MKPRLLQTAFALCALALSLPVAAAQRTFVASTGSDANPCSLTLPCRGFAAAVAAVDAGGEVVVLDSAGYGTFDITKSVSVIAPDGVYAGIALFSGQHGIMINGADIDVTLRGLTINGQGGHTPIAMMSGRKLDVDRVTITNFPYGTAIFVSGETNVTVANTTILNVQTGMRFADATARVSHSRLAGITISGIVILGCTQCATTTVTVTDSSVTCEFPGGSEGFANRATGPGPPPPGGGGGGPFPAQVGRMFLTRVAVSNCGVGVRNFPYLASPLSMMSLGDSLLSGNFKGIDNALGYPFYTAGNNHLVGNGTDVDGTITLGGVY